MAPCSWPESCASWATSPHACRFRWTTPGRCPSSPCAEGRWRRPSNSCSVSAPASRSARPLTRSRRSRIWSGAAGSKSTRRWATPCERARSSVCRCPPSRLATGSCPASTATWWFEKSRGPSGETLRGEAPHAADGRLVGERELREREIGREIVEDGAHALSDGDVALRLGLEVWRDEVADDAERLVRRRRAPLFVELDQDHRVGRPFLEARLDGVVHDLVGVDVALAVHVLPLPLEGHAPGTAVARRIAHEPTALAGAQHQLVLLAREL